MDPDGLFDFLEANQKKDSNGSSQPIKEETQIKSQRRKEKKRKSSPTSIEEQNVTPSTSTSVKNESSSNESQSTSKLIEPKEESNGNAKGKQKEKKDSKRARIAPIPTTKVTDEFTAEAIRQVPAAANADGATYHEDASTKQEGSSSTSSATAPGGIVATDASVVPSLPTTGSLSLTHSVRHQVALPPNYPYVPLSQHVPPEEPARTYPFTLDPFQQTSIHSIQRGESVLVSAHTSAGKTVVAEYAIAQALKGGMRVVYTSPIKALSNQKYRELSAEFGDVGLMTGDVTINPSASCLVMTTEILRSMLYRGSEVMREVAWVIFDEIHYMRDSERGVVWEETIILLPRKVRYVFLSATIPNAMQFAEWIAHTHLQPCHVVYTDFRPTPLQHYLFPASAEGIHLVVDERGTFREDNFQKAMGALDSSENSGGSGSGGGRRGGKGGRGGERAGGGKAQTGRKGGAKDGAGSDIYKIVKMIMLKNYNPVIVFAFSKRECEALALQMSKLEFNTEDEREMVSTVFENAVGALGEEDRELPQIEHILPLLRRGIGIHHGGLLPILKEVIEILFQEGLIKVLFATETFSIGLNMPAKTVVFTSVSKWDGKQQRNLSGGEYIQMSGRAGRRGLDDRGIVIMMFDSKLEPASAKAMVQGEADRLDSAFHLGYNMILNLMRVEGISPEYMLQRCFFQFQNAGRVPELEAELVELEKDRDDLEVEREEEIKDYFEVRKQLKSLGRDLQAVISHPTYSLSFLQPGRLVHIKHEDLDFGWGCCVNYQKKIAAHSSKGKGPEAEEELPQGQYIVDVLLRCASGSQVPREGDKTGRDSVGAIDWGASGTLSPVSPDAPSSEGEMLVVPVLLSTVERISGIRIFLPKDLRDKDSREVVRRNLAEVSRRFPEPKGLPLLDPVKDMKIVDEPFKVLLQKISVLEKRVVEIEKELGGSNSKKLKKLYDAYLEKDNLIVKVEDMKKKIQVAESILQLDELKCRKRVLRRLGFTDENDVVEKKGRVACEISTGDELLLTEMIFNGVFNDLEPEQCAALLSCFVFTEKSKKEIQLKEDLAAPLRVMQETARRIARVSRESRLPLDETEYVSSFKVELMDAVLKWCQGAKFVEICKLTDIFEGSLIRTFRRLQELIRQMMAAAKAIGNGELEEKFTKSLAKLERENSIIFSPSLYL